VRIEKRFVRKKPNTNVALTDRGRKGIVNHWSQLERLREYSRVSREESRSGARRP